MSDDDRTLEDFEYRDEPDEMDPGDEVGDLEGVDPHRIEPASMPPDEGDAESEEAQVPAEREAPPAEPEIFGAAGRPSVSGLTAPQRLKARELAVRAAMLGLRRAASLHYTQGGRRWDGIRLGLKAYKGGCPNYGDCSSFATWCLWNGLDHFGVRDTVNGARWTAGYTGTMVGHGARVSNRKNVLRGDLALYGDPFGGTGHVTIVVGHRDGRIRVVSFGSDPGPFFLDADYRADLKQFRRYV